MPITRAKASQLLNQKEMALYDDSRVNALRRLDAKALTARVGRARTARDRARDLVQKHKLASRARTGSKRGTSGVANQRSKDKAELMADILKRFEARLREVGREEKAAARAARSSARKPAAKKKAAAAKKTAASGARAKPAARPTAKTAAGKRTSPAGVAKKRTAAKSAASGATAKKAPAGKKAASRRPRKAARTHITPEQALAQTHALLEAKQAHDSAPKPWQEAPGAPALAGQPGFQSDSAARRARRLHAAEARIPAIQGSSSTRDRINQGKRDHRGDEGD